MQTRTGRLIVNSIFSLLGWAAPAVLGILVTPIILGYLGAESYGVYLVILGFMSYAITPSVGRAVAKFVAEYRASGDVEKINSAITVGFWIHLAGGVLTAILTVVLSRWVVEDVLQISAAYKESAKTALILCGLSVPIVLLGQVFQNVLLGEHRFGKLSLISNLNWLFINLGNVVLASQGFGIDSLLLLTLAVSFVIAVITFVVARHQSPDLRLRFGSTRVMARPVIIYSSSIFVYQIFGSLLILFERSWLIRNFGGSAASFYLVTMALVLYFHSFMTTLLAASFPVMNELLADPGRLLSLYRKAKKITLAFTVPFVITAILGGRMFLSGWIDPDFAAQAFPLLVIHSLTFGLMVLALPAWQLNEVHRAAGINALIVVIWAAISISLMFFAGKAWGEEGVAAARLVGVVVTLPMILYSEHRFLEKILWRDRIELFTKAAAAGLILAAIECFVFSAVGSGWASLFLGTIAGMLGYAAVLLITKFITDDERALVTGFVSRLWTQGQ
jgi:O-antigen/teichoic acid export membrane protein